MCDNIVGSEEHVKTIRMMNTVRDNLQSNNYCTHITSGSFGEGLEMKGSDLDIMYVIKVIEVCEDANFRSKRETSYFIMQIEDSQPGFIQLQLVYTNDQIIHNDCEKIGYDYYYSSFLFKRHFAENTVATVHGPCLSDERGILDLAFCLHSKSWVTPAKQWITRSNTSWPMCEVKQTILKHGVLFVPIGVKGSMKEDLEWLISFSVGEKLLIFTFTHTQLLCYALMKILLKDVIASNLNVSDLLCSYFMKTVMFLISEELSTSIWKPEKIDILFHEMF
ncbi:uncharacterized protein LOC127714800 [Mytilus californianus]|uniref:uncharacterized protein LOC127714800 n=1 Tax=Mytilus californianus TaxID=6549 RepID=UPI0022480AC6|nr:uncharacterized protein LOC127714800 [Mytilus californianus]